MSIMADTNTSRKRKSDSLLNTSKDSKNVSDELETHNDAEEIDACEEPEAKIPKIDIPEPNLEGQTATDAEPEEEPKLSDPENTASQTDNEDTTNDIAVQNDEEKPIITIAFSNDEAIEQYKGKFLTFLSKFAELKHIQIKNEIHLVVIEDDDEKSKEPKAKKELFVLDTNPAENKAFAPKYKSKFKVTDGAESDEEVKNVQSCFNCNGDHNLRDCKEPKNFAKIKSARNKFKSNAAQKSARYHLEEDQKFAHFAPGKLSEKLRNALGLRKNDLPAHIYKMRVLGYPPGWLEEAKLTHSNLSLFDSDGKDIKSKIAKRELIDPKKIVDYPGFNTRMKKGTRDDARAFGVPHFSEDHSKEAMIKFIVKMQEKMEDNLETCDMDIDASSDKECPPPPGVEEPAKVEAIERTSPSLNDLESQKQQLLAELIDENSTSNPDKIKALAVDKNDESVIEINDSIITIEDSFNSTPNNSVKTSTFGTPILKSASPYSRLPNADNFMKDVSPMINFENLPNSTGKYEQMTGVLDKVRKTLKNIQDKT